PDRSDILQAKAQLEERLMRFGDAITSYTQLYELAYRNPEWLIKAAELRARSGQPAEAVKALEKAVIGARSETVDADFTIATYLQAWHIPDALRFAERGASLAGADLMSGPHASDYARIMTRARRMDAVLTGLAMDQANMAVAQAAGNVIAELYTPE